MCRLRFYMFFLCGLFPSPPSRVTVPLFGESVVYCIRNELHYYSTRECVYNRRPVVPGRMGAAWCTDSTAQARGAGAPAAAPLSTHYSISASATITNTHDIDSGTLEECEATHSHHAGPILHVAVGTLAAASSVPILG